VNRGPADRPSAAPGARPLASVSLDLDNEWAYLKTHGDAGWESYPSYLDLVVPRILEVLSRRRLRITFFVVGQDAALAGNRCALRAIVDAGHEIANHSLRHDPWLHRLADDEIEHEIAEAERQIAAATGVRPTGFRGPGFSCSPAVLRTLAARGYAYDASSLPSFLGPLARAYYLATLATGRAGAAQRERLDGLFGGWREGLRPLAPYRWRTGAGSLLEIPVTTFPVLRAPIHLSYVMYAARWSRPLARGYFSAAVAACRLSGVGPSILLHPLDFLDGDDVPRLRFFPSMDLPASRKVGIVEHCLDALASRFEPVPMGEHAAVASRADLPLLDVA
jgi:hypothetical protein